MKLFKLQIKRIKFALVLIGLKSKHGSLLLGSPRAGCPITIGLHFLHCQKKVLEQYRMVDGRYELLLKSGQGPLDCFVLPNFVVDIRAFFDRHAHLEALKQLLA